MPDDPRARCAEILGEMLNHEIDAETANIKIEPLGLTELEVDEIEAKLRGRS